MKIYLVEATQKILSVMSENASSKVSQYLKDLNVEVLLNEAVVDYDGKVVKTKSGKKIHSRNLIWAAGVKGQLPEGIDSNFIIIGQRIKTNEYLKVEGYNNVFAIGDVAACISTKTPKGHPQVAQPAIQQGDYLAENFLRTIQKRPLKPFIYKDKGSLATVGKRKAVADIGKLKFSGYTAWLVWSFVHLMSISGFKNKLLVGLNWAVSYFSYDKSNRLIIRNFKVNNKESHE